MLTMHIPPNWNSSLASHLFHEGTAKEQSHVIPLLEQQPNNSLGDLQSPPTLALPFSRGPHFLAFLNLQYPAHDRGEHLFDITHVIAFLSTNNNFSSLLQQSVTYLLPNSSIMYSSSNTDWKPTLDQVLGCRRKVTEQRILG